VKISITYRLFLAILTATVVAVVCMFLIMQWSIDRGFLRYVNGLEQKRIALLASWLEESYAGHGNWNFLRNDPSLWDRIVAATIPDEEEDQAEGDLHDNPGETPPDRDVPPPDGFHRSSPPPPPKRHFSPRYLLLDAGKIPLFGPAQIPPHSDLWPIRHQSRVVGYIGLLTRKNMADIRQLSFVKEQKLALGMVTAILALLTAGLAFPLAGRLLQPVRALAAATRRLSAGEYTSRVAETSDDELGQLARDFNALAMTLEKNEQARRQWVADISHELRTPLAVLRGEVEAIQDGIRRPDQDSIRSLHGEVMRLSRLVDDLYQLSLSDLGALTYRKEEIDLAGLVMDALAFYRPEFVQKGIAQTEDIQMPGGAVVFGDHERLRQLFTNLLENALKYTDEGGKVAVRLDCRGEQATIDIQDSAPGVPESELERLFERLYRVEGSRNRAAGGAGLGLAICRNIVEAHAGTIVARPSPLGGVWICVTLPLAVNCR
jgi:two-component system, OmpR family, sensor histidine kinase BaeS